MALLLGTGSGGLTRVRKRDYTDLGSPPQRRPSSSSSSSSSSTAAAAPLLVSSDRNHRTRKNQGRPRIEEDDRQRRFEEEEEVEEDEEVEELDLRAVWSGARGSSAGAAVASAWQKAADRADLRDPAVGSYRYVEEERDYKPLYVACHLHLFYFYFYFFICSTAAIWRTSIEAQGMTRGHVCVQASPESGQPSQCHRLPLRTFLTPPCAVCGACSLQGNRCRTRWSG
jgi:hypothetical protein